MIVKKDICLLICMALSLVFLAGCENYSNSILAVGTKNTVTKIASDQPAETTNWDLQYMKLSTTLMVLV